MAIERYTSEMANEVACLIEDSFAEHRRAPAIQLIGPPAPWSTREQLLEVLTGVDVCAEASHVAMVDDRLVSAAIAVEGSDGCGWWRIATAPEHRRQGLATACIRAAERALVERGQERLETEEVVDSRWEASEALLASLGYELENPEERNITMVAPEWTPREVDLPEGYGLDTLREENIGEWVETRDEVFDSERSVEWFRNRFVNRPDWDETGWFVIRHDGSMIGIASAVCVEDERAPDELRGAQIEWVGVLDEHRGLHLGQKLVVACMNYAVERGFLPVQLITQPFRVPAISLYEKLGFRTVAAWHSWAKELE